MTDSQRPNDIEPAKIARSTTEAEAFEQNVGSLSPYGALPALSEAMRKAAGSSDLREHVSALTAAKATLPTPGSVLSEHNRSQLSSPISEAIAQALASPPALTASEMLRDQASVVATFADRLKTDAIAAAASGGTSGLGDAVSKIAAGSSLGAISAAAAGLASEHARIRDLLSTHSVTDAVTAAAAGLMREPETIETAFARHSAVDAVSQAMAPLMPDHTALTAHAAHLSERVGLQSLPTLTDAMASSAMSPTMPSGFPRSSEAVGAVRRISSDLPNLPASEQIANMATEIAGSHSRVGLADTSVRNSPSASPQSPPGMAPVDPIRSVADVGQRVRAARQSMGMTQQRFADLAGVGRRFLIELEHGKASLEMGRVLAVCHAAGIKLGFLE